MNFRTNLKKTSSGAVVVMRETARQTRSMGAEKKIHENTALAELDAARVAGQLALVGSFVTPHIPGEARPPESNQGHI
jgi:hypothetical protein